MSETVDNLILDLLEWIGPGERPYVETMEAWRTSCPRLPVWEDATDLGFIERHHEPARAPSCRSQQPAPSTSGSTGRRHTPDGSKADLRPGVRISGKGPVRKYGKRRLTRCAIAASMSRCTVSPQVFSPCPWP